MKGIKKGIGIRKSIGIKKGIGLKNTKSLKFKFSMMSIASIVLTIVVLSGVLVFELNTSKEETRKELHEILVDNVYSTSTQQMYGIAGGIEGEFKSIRSVVSILATNASAKEIVIPGEEETSKPYLIRSLDSIQSTNEDILFSYVATEGKKMYISSNSPAPPEGFDPTERPWYMSAKNNPNKVMWSDPYIDTGTGGLVITASRAILGDSGNIIGVAGLDITLETIKEYIKKYTIGTTGYIMLTDSEGIILSHPTEKLIGTEVPVKEVVDLIKKVKSGESLTIEYSYEDEDKLGVATRLNEIPLVIVGTLPESDVFMLSNQVTTKLTEMADNILRGILISVVLILFFSVFLTTKVLNKTLNPIKEAVDFTRQVSEGNLENTITTKDESEIGVLIKAISSMRDSLVEIVTNLKSASEDLNSNSEILVSRSANMAESTKNVSFAIEDIAKGAVNQAEEVETASNKMEVLSSNMENLKKINEELAVSANSLNKTKLIGDESIEELLKQTDITVSSAEEITSAITVLQNAVSNITEVTSTIENIASQTNLLALNASIEAARAGEAGKGFAVVAEEIRKLADQTRTATLNIKDTVSDVISQMEDVGGKVTTVNDTVRGQESHTTKVKDSFNHISKEISNMLKKIEVSIEELKSVAVSKDDVMDSVKGIAAVAEETAASSEEINASVEDQTTSASELSEQAKRLNNINETINQIVGKFRI